MPESVEARVELALLLTETKHRKHIKEYKKKRLQRARDMAVTLGPSSEVLIAPMCSGLVYGFGTGSTSRSADKKTTRECPKIPSRDGMEPPEQRRAMQSLQPPTSLQPELFDIFSWLGTAHVALEGLWNVHSFSLGSDCAPEAVTLLSAFSSPRFTQHCLVLRAAVSHIADILAKSDKAYPCTTCNDSKKLFSPRHDRGSLNRPKASWRLRE